MSVINQMLVDLERRRASGEERNRIPSHVRALPDNTSGVRQPLIWLVGGLLTAALLAIAVWWWRSGRAPVVTPSVPVAKVTVPVPAPGPEARDTEFIARRLTLDLARMPDPVESVPETVNRDAPPGIDTSSLLAPRTAPSPRVEVLADKPRAPAPAPAQKKVIEAPAATPAAVEIDKKFRQPTQRQRADAEYSKGATALHRGQAADARAAFEAALQIDSLHHGARQALVGVLLDERQPAAAMRVLQEGLQLAPGQNGFAMTLARLQVENGELDAGVQTLARSIESPGVSPDYLAFYAGLLQRQQKHAEAAQQFQRALQRRGNVGLWLLGLGVSLEALGRVADAQEAYQRARTSGNLSPELQAFADQKLR